MGSTKVLKMDEAKVVKNIRVSASGKTLKGFGEGVKNKGFSFLNMGCMKNIYGLYENC